MANKLGNILRNQLDQKVAIAAKRISEEFGKTIANTDFASKYASLEKQGDLSPLQRGKNYKGRGASIPDAIEQEFSQSNGLNISKIGNRTQILFGNKAFLVSLSPQILWYEYGYARGQSSKGDEGIPFIPSWFKLARSRKNASARMFWVRAEGFGRMGEGSLFPQGHRFIQAAKKKGKFVSESSRPIPEVAMYRKTLLTILPRLPKIIRGF